MATLFLRQMVGYIVIHNLKYTIYIWWCVKLVDGILRTSTVNQWPENEKKNVTIEDGQGEPAKGPPMVKLDFSLGVKYSEWVNRNAYLWFDKVGSFFIESLEWVYLLGAINIVGDVWT